MPLGPTTPTEIALVDVNFDVFIQAVDMYAPLMFVSQANFDVVMQRPLLEREPPTDVCWKGEQVEETVCYTNATTYAFLPTEFSIDLPPALAKGALPESGVAYMGLSVWFTFGLLLSARIAVVKVLLKVSVMAMQSGCLSASFLASGIFMLGSLLMGQLCSACLFVLEDRSACVNLAVSSHDVDPM